MILQPKRMFACCLTGLVILLLAASCSYADQEPGSLVMDLIAKGLAENGVEVSRMGRLGLGASFATQAYRDEAGNPTVAIFIDYDPVDACLTFWAPLYWPKEDRWPGVENLMSRLAAHEPLVRFEREDSRVLAVVRVPLRAVRPDGLRLSGLLAFLVAAVDGYDPLFHLVLDGRPVVDAMVRQAAAALEPARTGIGQPVRYRTKTVETIL